MANGLLKRLQFPLTLGSYIKAQEIGEQYLIRVLTTKMTKKSNETKPEDIAKCLSREYVDHGFCINFPVARKIGLNVKLLEDELLDITWELHKLYKCREEIMSNLHKEKVMEDIAKLPPSIIDKIMSEPRKSSNNEV